MPKLQFVHKHSGLGGEEAGPSRTHKHMHTHGWFSTAPIVWLDAAGQRDKLNIEAREDVLPLNEGGGCVPNAFAMLETTKCTSCDPPPNPLCHTSPLCGCCPVPAWHKHLLVCLAAFTCSCTSSFINLFNVLVHLSHVPHNLPFSGSMAEQICSC